MKPQKIGADILFMAPPGGDIGRFKQQIGLAFLQSVLDDVGIKSTQFTPKKNPSMGEISNYLSKVRPRIIGLTVYESNIDICHSVSKMAKSVLKDVIIVVGGPSATFSPIDVMDRTSADICNRGAGEGIVTEMVQSILGTDGNYEMMFDNLSKISNLVLSNNGNYFFTEEESLSSFPSKYFKELDDIPSPYSAGYATDSDVGILTARGCNQNCTYCNFAALSGRKVAFHSIDRVINDIGILKRCIEKHGYLDPIVPIFDDAFSLLPKRAHEICEAVISSGMQLPFGGMTRADRVDRDLLFVMKKAGFASIGFGLESAVPRILRNIGKVSNPATTNDDNLEAEYRFLEAVKKAVSICKELGIKSFVSIMAGLPGETNTDLNDTLNFVKSLDLPYYVHNYLQVFPGTPLYANCENYGIEVKKSSMGRIHSTIHAYDSASITPLMNSSIHQSKWDEAHMITDAICGRRRLKNADKQSVWAMIIDGAPPNKQIACWLSGILAVQGCLIINNSKEHNNEVTPECWSEILIQNGCHPRVIALLDRIESDATLYKVKGTWGDHNVRFDRDINPRYEMVGIDEAGNCNIRVDSIYGSKEKNMLDCEVFFESGVGALQTINACFWFEGWRRCDDIKVLHIDLKGNVMPCWNGPIIGNIGDSYDEIDSNMQSILRDSDKKFPMKRKCPLNNVSSFSTSFKDVLFDAELTSQLFWYLRIPYTGAHNINN